MAPSREGARRLLLATFGNGQHGRLGHGTQASELFPRAVAGVGGGDGGDGFGGAAVVSVACGGAHTVCVTADGGLWSWGMNDRGQLGHSGDRAFVAEPTEVILPVRVAAVAAGEAHTLALTTDGEVWAAGCNGGGQLGLGARLSDALASSSSRNSSSGGDSRSPDFRLVRALAGESVDGGPRRARRRVVGVAAGTGHSLAVDARGTVWSWGLGGYGALGLGRGRSRSAHPTPQVVAPFYGEDRGGGAPPSPPSPSSPSPSSLSAVAVAAGGHHSGAIDAPRGLVYAWGHGLWHQLGLEGPQPPENECEPRPVASLSRAGPVARLAMGHAHTLAVVGSGGGGGGGGGGRGGGGGGDGGGGASDWRGGLLASWGSDESGCLGQGMLWPRTYSPLPAPVHAAGTDDGRGGPAAGFFSGWGKKKAPAPPPPPPPLQGVVDCAAGWKHSAAVGAGGELWTWGWGGAPGAGGLVGGAGADLGGGQLGIGDPGEDRYAPARVQRLVLSAPGGGGGGKGVGGASGVGGRPSSSPAFLDLRGGGVWRALQVSCGRNHTAAVVEVMADDVG